MLVPYFYEDDVPWLPLQIPDFRTLDSERPEEPSPELYDVISQSLSRRDWLNAYLEDIGEDKVSFVGSCSGMGRADCAARMREIIGLNPGWARGLSKDAAVRVLREAMERVGVFIYAGSYVGNSTNRPLKIEEFRGFVLSDEYAPVIFSTRTTPTLRSCSSPLRRDGGGRRKSRLL